MQIILIIFLVLALAFCYFSIQLIFDSFILFSHKLPFLPSKRSRIQQIEYFVNKHDPEKKAKILDVGSGDGRVVIFLRNRGFNIEGIEINPFVNLVAKIKGAMFCRRFRIFKHKDVFKINLSKYDMIILYGITEFNKKISPKLKKELKKGSIVISNTFELYDIELVEEKDGILVYTI